MERKAQLFADGERPDQSLAAVAKNGEVVRLFEVVFEAGIFVDLLHAPELVFGDADALGGGQIGAAVGAGNGGHACS